MRRWEFQGSAKDPYVTQINETTGLLSCSCPGWTMKKQGKVRECKHTRQVAQDEHLALQQRDEQWFVVDQALPFPEGQAEALASRLVPVVPVKEEGQKGGFIKPMLATKMPTGKDADSYTRDEYAMEEKFDGHRLIVEVGETVRAWSRLGNRRTLPEHILRAVTHLPHGTYDGEIMVPGMHSYDVVAGQNSGLEQLQLFDILTCLGQDVMKKPQSERRKLLEKAYDHIDGADQVSITDWYTPSMAKVQEIWDRGGEGAIIKRLSAVYRPEYYRSPDWVKVKAEGAATLTILGFKAGESGPYSSIKLRDDAGIETTVKTLNNDELRAIKADPQSYIGRRLVISYHEKTKDGHYRHPMFDHYAGESE